MISKIKINTETTKDLNDEQLDDLVYSKAVDLHLGTFGETFKDNDQDKLLKDIFSLTVLDNEIKNGGFDQFFKNNAVLKDFAMSGLRIIKADKHAELLTIATKLYQEQREQFKDKRNTNLDTLDESYYQLDDIGQLRQKFIKKNINKFVD